MFVAIFAGALLVNGLLALLAIAWLEAIGWWDSTAVAESFLGQLPGRRGPAR